MAELTVQRISKAGLDDLATALAAAGASGDSVNAASGLFLAIANGDSSAHTVTVAAPTSTADTPRYGDLPVSAIAFEVAAGETGLLTIPPGYADASGDFAWTYDDVTSVTVGVFSLAP